MARISYLRHLDAFESFLRIVIAALGVWGCWNAKRNGKWLLRSLQSGHHSDSIVEFKGCIANPNLVRNV